jgi:hypothetical protein
MKYIRKTKKKTNTFPLGFVTETVNESAFTQAHKDLGGWELVSDAEAEAAMNNNTLLLTLHKAELEVEHQQKIEELEKLQANKAEFEAFKAWKASQS